MTTASVRRCLRAGCRPGGTGEPCRGACLPDPEDADTWLCWLGGPVPWGEPCTRSFECQARSACAADGLCHRVCTEEGRPCSTPGQVCRGFVCTPEEAAP